MQQRRATQALLVLLAAGAALADTSAPHVAAWEKVVFPFTAPAGPRHGSQNFTSSCYNFIYAVSREMKHANSSAAALTKSVQRSCEDSSLVRCQQWAEDLSLAIQAKLQGKKDATYSHWCVEVMRAKSPSIAKEAFKLTLSKSEAAHETSQLTDAELQARALKVLARGSFKATHGTPPSKAPRRPPPLAGHANAAHGTPSKGPKRKLKGIYKVGHHDEALTATASHPSRTTMVEHPVVKKAAEHVLEAAAEVPRRHAPPQPRSFVPRNAREAPRKARIVTKQERQHGSHATTDTRPHKVTRLPKMRPQPSFKSKRRVAKVVVKGRDGRESERQDTAQHMAHQTQAVQHQAVQAVHKVEQQVAKLKKAEQVEQQVAKLRHAEHKVEHQAAKVERRAAAQHAERKAEAESALKAGWDDILSKEDDMQSEILKSEAPARARQEREIAAQHARDWAKPHRFLNDFHHPSHHHDGAYIEEAVQPRPASRLARAERFAEEVYDEARGLTSSLVDRL